jgi:hypothetical protein
MESRGLGLARALAADRLRFSRARLRMFPLQILIRHAACIEKEIERVVACALVETRLFIYIYIYIYMNI